MDSYSIPIDLIREILSRLPAKSVARFRCVSKQWASILSHPSFTESFLTRSSAKPRLLLAIEEDGVWSFFSAPQLQNPYEKSSSSSSSTLVVAAEFHTKLYPDRFPIRHDSDVRYFSCGYASGLIYLYGGRYEGRPLVCNPNTGRYAALPYLHSYRKSYSFFGFDPIGKQYKVLFMAYPAGPGHHKILTLGDMSGWRKIRCCLKHESVSQGICVNGVLYYLADTSQWTNMSHDVTSHYVIVCFDVRSEKFTFINLKRLRKMTNYKLINYEGKLAVIFRVDNVVDNDWEDDGVDDDSEEDDGFDNYLEEDELHVWVLEDVEKQEWSKHAYDLFYFGEDLNLSLSLAGATASGEIVFLMGHYVVYFNLESNNFRRVDIRGLPRARGFCPFVDHIRGLPWGSSFCTFVDHIEDLNVNDPTLLESVHTPYVDPGDVGFSDSDSDSE